MAPTCRSPVRLPLPLPEYRHWIDCIRTDDGAGAETILDGVGDDDEEVERLLNGAVEFPDLGAVVENLAAKNYRITRPFILAAAYGSLRILNLLVRRGADVLHAEDVSGYNVIHCLVCVAFYEPRREAELVRTYEHLCCLLPIEQTAELLYAESERGLRPLEFAAQQGALKLMAAVLDTKDVYLTREEIVDVTTYRWYDISDYEAPSDSSTTVSGIRRKLKSPLYFMLTLDRGRMEEFERTRLFTGDGITRDWIVRRYSSRRRLLTYLLVLRLVFIGLLWLYETDPVWLERLGGVETEAETTGYQRSEASAADVVVVVNASIESAASNASFVFCRRFAWRISPLGFRCFVATVLVLHSIVIVVVELLKLGRTVAYFSRNPDTLRNLAGQKTFIVSTGRFIDKFCELLSALLVIAEVALLADLRRGADGRLLAVDVIRFLLAVMLLWNIMLFLQILPAIGDMIIYIRQMTSDLMGWSVMFSFYSCVFARQMMLFFNANSRQGQWQFDYQKGKRRR